MSGQPRRATVIFTGGTISMRHDPEAGGNVPRLSAADILARLPDLERQAEEYERKARALRQVAEGMRQLNGELSLFFPEMAPAAAEARDEKAKTSGPRGREAVRIIVSERPGIWALTDRMAEMQLRGSFTSRKATEVAVKRLCDRGEGRRIGTGRYVFPDDRKEVAVESEASGAAMIAS